MLEIDVFDKAEPSRRAPPERRMADGRTKLTLENARYKNSAEVR